MVSIIVPVYNAEKTITACVKSIQEQIYKDYELILVDDGSTDRSGPICDEIQAQFIERGLKCQVIHQQNGGVSKARNTGMDHANGEYFVCIDSDDVVEPCYLEDLVRAAEEHPEFGHVLCGFRCTSHVHDYILSKKEPLTIVDRKDYMRLYDAILVQGPCLGLYRTEIVHKNHMRMQEGLSLGEDLLFNLSYMDALDNTAIGVVNKSNYIYQDEDQNSLSRRYREDLQMINELIIDSIRTYLSKWDVKDADSWKRYQYAAFYKYKSVLDNTFLPHNSLSKPERLAINNKIMQKESFQEAVREMKKGITPSLKRAYQSGNYRHVMRAERIQKVKSMAVSIFRFKLN